MSKGQFSVSIQPSKEQVKAGIEELLLNLPDLEDDVDEDQLSDTVVFVWQAMLNAR